MPAAIQDTWVLQAHLTAFNQQMIVDFPYVVSTGNPAPSDNTITNEIITVVRGGVGGGDLLESKLLALLTTEFTLNNWRCQKIFSNRAAYVVVTRGVIGSYVASIMNTGNLAVSITKRTALSGRKFVGRFQIPGPPENARLNGNVILTGAYGAALTTFNTAALAPITTPTGVVLLPAIFHRLAPSITTPILTLQVQPTIRTMHRRTVGLGV